MIELSSLFYSEGNKGTKVTHLPQITQVVELGLEMLVLENLAASQNLQSHWFSLPWWGVLCLALAIGSGELQGFEPMAGNSSEARTR